MFSPWSLIKNKHLSLSEKTAYGKLMYQTWEETNKRMQSGEPNEYNTMNERIKLLREENGFSQAQVGRVLSMVPQEYLRYEKAGYSVKMDKLAALSAFYNVSIDWLSGWSKERRPFADDYALINGYYLPDYKEALQKGEVYDADLNLAERIRLSLSDHQGEE